MDKIKQYRQLIEQVLTAHGQIKPVYEDVEMHTAFDGEGEHYQVVRSGWNQGRRVYGSLIHIDLKDSKIWIQYDGTEVGVTNELVELGVPKQDIVLAYHSPLMRQYDGFAVG